MSTLGDLFSLWNLRFIAWLKQQADVDNVKLRELLDESLIRNDTDLVADRKYVAFAGDEGIEFLTEREAREVARQWKYPNIGAAVEDGKFWDGPIFVFE